MSPPSLHCLSSPHHPFHTWTTAPGALLAIFSRVSSVLTVFTIVLIASNAPAPSSLLPHHFRHCGLPLTIDRCTSKLLAHHPLCTAELQSFFTILNVIPSTVELHPAVPSPHTTSHSPHPLFFITWPPIIAGKLHWRTHTLFPVEASLSSALPQRAYRSPRYFHSLLVAGYLLLMIN